MSVQAAAISRSDASAARTNAGPQEEVLGRIARDRELRQERRGRRLRRARVVESSENAPAVSLQIADDGVDLGQSEPHDGSVQVCDSQAKTEVERQVTIERRYRGPLDSG